MNYFSRGFDLDQQHDLFTIETNTYYPTVVRVRTTSDANALQGILERNGYEEKEKSE